MRSWLVTLLVAPLALASSGPDNHRPKVNAARELQNRAFKYTPPNRPKPATVAGTWFAGFHAAIKNHPFPPESVPYTKYTTVTYAFAETTPDASKLDVVPAEVPILKKVVSLGHAAGTKVTLSVGGWTGSRFYSWNVGSKANRTAFINSLNRLVDTYSLDGIDFDWEYPNSEGIGCNHPSSKDTANFLQMLKDLRASKMGYGKTLSAAVAITPFVGPDGSPSSDVSEFAKYLDYIAIMNYDIYGPWAPTAGPNGALNDTCVTNQALRLGSAVSAVKAWTGAGFPKDQIVLGVPNYGHSFTVKPADAYKSGTKTLRSSYPKFDATNLKLGDAWDDVPGKDVCGNTSGPGGNYNLWGLIDNGFLKKDGTVADGNAYLFDTCTQTPSVYNEKKQVWVAYDDARSFKAKGKYVKDKGLRGFASWEAGGDYNSILLDAIRQGAGLS